MSTPRAGFFGIGVRGADVTFAGFVSGVVVLYHVALGFICQGIGRGIQLLETMRTPRTPIVDPTRTVPLIESSTAEDQFSRGRTAFA